MKHEVKKVLVFVELQDGSIKQVVSNDTQKNLALNMLVDENGSINIS